MVFVVIALVGLAAYFYMESTNANGTGITDVASNAGFTGLDLAIATAIALAESGGDPNAYNPETAAGAAEGKGSYGLWQIYLTMHPEYEGQNLYDPQTNANAAFAIYTAAGNSFKPWSTFKGGQYQAFLVTDNDTDG